jgi:hypothetical protein
MASDVAVSTDLQAGFARSAIGGHALLIIGAVGIASTGFVPLMHGLNPALAILVEILLAFAIMVAVPAYAPLVAIFVLLFQNLFVSIFSPIIEISQLEIIKGYNFLVCAVMWATATTVFLFRYSLAAPAVKRFMMYGFAVFAVIGGYYLIGLTQDALAATIYLRNIVLPLFLFQLSLLTASVFKTRATPAIIAIGAVAILCGYFELIFRDAWLDVTNGHAYWQFDEIKATESGQWERQMRATGDVLVSLQDRFKFSLFNTPLLEGLGLSEVLRVFGPNISAISYAYGIAFFMLFAFSTGRYVLFAAGLPLLLFCGVKGALILILFVLAGWTGTRLLGPRPTLLAGLLAVIAYVIAGIYIGLQIGDYHVIGFMGGWNGFMQWPLGRGLGVGGNLSVDFSSIDWSAAQQAGAVDGAVESAVGVLLYQMGLMALIPLAYCFAIALFVWRTYARSGMMPQGLVAFGIIVTLANGIFQEEALFAPLALGLLLSLGGLAIGNLARVEQSASLPPNASPA